MILSDKNFNCKFIGEKNQGNDVLGNIIFTPSN